MKNQNNKSQDQVQIPEVSTETTSTSKTLPSFKSCLVDSWQFVKTRFDLVLLVTIATIPSIYLSVMEYGNEDFINENQGLSSLIFLWTLIISPLVSLLLVYIILNRNNNPSLKTASRSLPRLILPFLWLMVLSTLVVFGGLLLLIVPAIIFSIYMIFSTSVFIAEDKRGLSVLTRSHQLVSGHWLAIAGRVIGISLIWGLVTLLVSIFGVAGLVISGVLQALSIIAILFVVVTLYQSRAEVFDPTQSKPAPKLLYKVMVLLGVLAILSGAILAMIGLMVLWGASFI